MPRVIDNRNTLVATTPWVTGVKTGQTTNAGYVLVGRHAMLPYQYFLVFAR